MMDVSFSVSEGEIFGIIGPNGAGKTTTVECISGMRIPDSGVIDVLGLDPQADRAAIRESVGVQLPADPATRTGTTPEATAHRRAG
jgi:ABC-2 type transport system ATP-binding protein